jgi:hypothetical protein
VATMLLPSRSMFALSRAATVTTVFILRRVASTVLLATTVLSSREDMVVLSREDMVVLSREGMAVLSREDTVVLSREDSVVLSREDSVVLGAVMVVTRVATPANLHTSIDSKRDGSGSVLHFVVWFQIPTAIAMWNMV